METVTDQSAACTSDGANRSSDCGVTASARIMASDGIAPMGKGTCCCMSVGQVGSKNVKCSNSAQQLWSYSICKNRVLSENDRRAWRSNYHLVDLRAKTDPYNLIHLPLIPQICVSELGQHSLSWWLVVCSAPNCCPNQCCRCKLDPWDQTSVKFKSKRKFCLHKKCRLRNGVHFAHGERS